MRTLSLAFLVVLAALAVLGLWILGDDGAPPELPGTSREGQNPAAGAPLATGRSAAENADAATNQATTGDAGARVEVAEAAWIGRIADRDGRSVANAVVSCTGRPDLNEAEMLELMQSGDLREVAEKMRGAINEVDTLSAADGSFRLRPPNATGYLELEVRARGYRPVTRKVTRPTDGDADLGTLTVERGGVLIGRVVDTSGRGIGDARVDTRSPDTPKWVDDMGAGDLAGFGPGGRRGDRTDSTGNFELGHVPPGIWHLRVTHPGHPPARLDNVTVAAGQVVENLVVVVQPGSAISGRVLNIPTGIDDLRVIARKVTKEKVIDGPLGAILPSPDELFDGMPFSFGSRTSKLGTDGSFSLDGLDLDTRYRLWAVQNDKGIMQMSPCTPRLEVPAGTQGVELRYEPGVSVTFLVIDAATQQPVEELAVQPELSTDHGFGLGSFLRNSRMGANRTAEYPGGRVTVSYLRPKEKETLELHLEATGYADFDRKAIELPRAGTLDLGTIALDPAPLVHVLVTEAASGEPVAGAKVTLDPVQEEPEDSGYLGGAEASPMMARFGGSAREGETDENGRCTLTSLPGETVAITVESEDHARYESDPVALPANKDVEHAAALLVGSSVAVHVADHHGSPVVDIRVDRRSEGGGGSRAVHTDAQGNALFERLSPGQHGFRLGGRPGRRHAGGGFQTAVRLRADGSETGGAPWDELDLVDGQHATLTLTKPPTAKLAGTVRENGIPLSRATVSFAEGAMATTREEIAGDLMGHFGGNQLTTKADGDGYYEFDELPAGQHRLRIQHRERAMSAVVEITLQEGDNTFDAELTTAVLRGRVTSEDGEPVNRAQVTVSIQLEDSDEQGEMAATMSAMSSFGLGSERGVKTDSDGAYELRGVQSEVPLVVTARDSDHAPAKSATVKLGVGATMVGVDLVMSAAGRISVRMEKAGMMNSVRANYAGEDEGVEPVFMFMRNGRATLEGLRPGPWKVVIRGPGDTPDQTETVEVAAGETAKVEF